MTRIEEQNAIRTAARNEFLPRFEAAFPEAVRIPGTSLYYLKGTNEWLTVEVKVPTINGRTRNGNGDEFDLNAVIEKANTELAEKEGIAFTYMARLMRLSLLSPELVDAVMDGHQPANITLANLMDPFPADWKVQHALWSDVN